MNTHHTDTTLHEKIREAENMIINGNPDAALGKLNEIESTSANRSRLAYDYGVISVMLGFPQRAERFLTVALANGYNTSATLLWLGKVYEQQGDKKNAEEMYQASLKEAEHNSYIPIMVLCDFYYRNRMFIMAERHARQLVHIQPENYYGNHMLVHIYIEKNMFNEATALLVDNEAKYADNPTYWRDREYVLERQGKYYTAIQLLLNEQKIKEVLADERLWYCVRLYLERMQNADAREIVEELAIKNNDSDALFFKMLFEMVDGEYNEASIIADRLLSAYKKEKNFLYYIIELIGIIARVRLQSPRENTKERDILLGEAEYCLDWFRQHGYPIKANSEELLSADVWKWNKELNYKQH